AAVVRSSQLHQLDSFQPREQISDLVETGDSPLAACAQPQLAQPMAALVKADPMREPPSKLHLEHVVKKLAKLVDFAAHLVELWGVGQQIAIMVANHRGATSGWTHHVAVAGENREEVPRQGSRLREAARVGHRLAAAGLLLGKVDLDALSLQQLDGREAHSRVELVYVARNEQANFNHDVSLASEPDAAASATSVRHHAW